MKDAEFVEWLKKKKGYSGRSASDAASRCRRVSRVFKVSLDDALSKEEGFESLRQRVTKETSRLVKSGGSEYSARGAHRLALKLYFEFLQT